MRIVSALLLSAVMLSGVLAVPSTASAQELNKPEAAKKFMEAENPHLKKLNTRTDELTKKLGEAELKNLFYIREAFGTVRAVAVVQRDVGAAVKSCGKANPDMKETMDARFKEWSDSVGPVIKDREIMMDQAITAQSYMKPKEVRDYLKLIQQTAEYADKSIEKNYATAKEDCESLMKSMDRTQEVVTELLADLKIPAYDPKDDKFEGVPENYKKAE
ncbi:hypothetical protein [Micavibrio aeruginosavorus]|uniref:hypothetical protein n=1 Tax=Micavibrio aeruginosavorus TaxID=349221 RepID=UPI003F4AB29A